MTEIRITVTNTSPNGGTFLTPFWFGLHDGSFDLYDRGEVASAGLEAIAEDGNAEGLGMELVDADADAQGGIIPGAAGPIAIGERTDTTVTVNGASNGFLSVAAMILPSNDAFVGTGEAVQLFDADGRFLGAQTITFEGSDVLDAGTEVNTELDAAFINQTAPNTGIDENGVVELHPGFNGSLGNPVGEGEQIILGGTNAFGEAIDPVAADFTQPGAQVASIHINEVARTDGTDGRDRIIGGREDDIVNAGDGSDFVLGRSGWDDINGGAGNDKILGGSGNDRLFGEDGRDFIFGGADDDLISGGAGPDKLFGGRGNDAILGGDGRDKIYAGSGDDVVNAGAGNDRVFLGWGSDTLEFVGGDGHDVVYGLGANDTLALSVEGIETVDDLFDAAYSRFGSTYVDFGDQGSLLLVGTTESELAAADILFV